MFPFSPVALFLPQLLWWHRHSCVSFILFLWTVFIARFYRLLPQPLQLMILCFLTLACQIYGFYWVHFLLRCLRRTLRLAASGMWCERHIHSWAGFWTDSTCLRKPQASRRLHHRPWRLVSEVVIISFYTPQQSRTSCLQFPRFLAADRCSVVVLKFVCVHLCDGGCGRCVWIASPRLSGWRPPAGRSASRCCLSSVELHWSLLWVFAVDVHRLILLSAASGWFRLHEVALFAWFSLHHVNHWLLNTTQSLQHVCLHADIFPPVICCFLWLDIRCEDYFNFASSSEKKCVSFEFLICETKAGNVCLSAHPVANSFYCFHLYLLPLLEGFYCGHQSSRFQDFFFFIISSPSFPAFTSSKTLKKCLVLNCHHWLCMELTMTHRITTIWSFADTEKTVWGLQRCSSDVCGSFFLSNHY